MMKEVYYKGQPYLCEVMDILGDRLYALYKDGKLIDQVKEEDLDIRSRVSLILEEYYSLSQKDSQPSF